VGPLSDDVLGLVDDRTAQGGGAVVVERESMVPNQVDQ
jgi:hypothetical protein